MTQLRMVPPTREWERRSCLQFLLRVCAAELMMLSGNSPPKTKYYSLLKGAGSRNVNKLLSK